MRNIAIISLRLRFPLGVRFDSEFFLVVFVYCKMDQRGKMLLVRQNVFFSCVGCHLTMFPVPTSFCSCKSSSRIEVAVDLRAQVESIVWLYSIEKLSHWHIKLRESLRFPVFGYFAVCSIGPKYHC